MSSWGERKIRTDNCPFKAGTQGKDMEKLQLPEVSFQASSDGCYGFRKQYGCSQMGFESVPSRKVNVDLKARRGERRHLKGPGAGVGLCGEH